MKISTKQYAESLYESVKGKSKSEIKKDLDNFFNVLVENNDVAKLDKIIIQFEKIWSREEGIVEAEVVSAKGLNKDIVKLLNSYISKLSGAKEVIMREEEDKNILGGVVIKYGDKVVDGSLKARIQNLKSQLVK